MKKDVGKLILTICHNKHKQIWFEGRLCPLCKFKLNAKIHMEQCYKDILEGQENVYGTQANY